MAGISHLFQKKLLLIAIFKLPCFVQTKARHPLSLLIMSIMPMEKLLIKQALGMCQQVARVSLLGPGINVVFPDTH